MRIGGGCSFFEGCFLGAVPDWAEGGSRWGYILEVHVLGSTLAQKLQQVVKRCAHMRGSSFAVDWVSATSGCRSQPYRDAWRKLDCLRRRR